MMRRHEQGSSTLSLLLSVMLVLGGLYWLLSDYLPADAEDLQSLVSLAAPSTEARNVLAASLKASPNPNRIALREMRRRVNDIVVTETARAVTGDKTLESAGERGARLKREEAARIARVQATPWGDLNGDDRAMVIGAWVTNLAVLSVFGLFIVGASIFGYRQMFGGRR